METAHLRPGSPIPAFRDIPGVDGKRYGVSDFSSARALVLVFSCNHCPYVQAYEGRMIAFQSLFKSRGVHFVAINSNETTNYPEDNFEGMVARAKAKGFNFPYLRDDDQHLAEAFGATHTPEFFVFGPDPGGGTMQLRYHGKFDDNYQKPAAVTRKYVEEAVEAVLAGKPVPEAETHSIGCTIKWKL